MGYFLVTQPPLDDEEGGALELAKGNETYLPLLEEDLRLERAFII